MYFGIYGCSFSYLIMDVQMVKVLGNFTLEFNYFILILFIGHRIVSWKLSLGSIPMFYSVIVTSIAAQKSDATWYWTFWWNLDLFPPLKDLRIFSLYPLCYKISSYSVSAWCFLKFIKLSTQHVLLILKTCFWFYGMILYFSGNFSLTILFVFTFRNYYY